MGRGSEEKGWAHNVTEKRSESRKISPAGTRVWELRLVWAHRNKDTGDGQAGYSPASKACTDQKEGRQQRRRGKLVVY
jgi:hypothetical protein